ncbi:MAG: hypothetical protein BEN19_03675, partial [Epulopiscium sp. Nuni2H_MBin003]
HFKSGIVTIDGKPIKNMHSKDFWKIVSYVPQAKSVQSGFSALDMVVLGMAPHLGAFAQPKQEHLDKAAQTLDELGVLYLKDKACNAMSGGELQMILMARAIITSPSILVLDEPESNLDFKNQLTILNAIKDLAAHKNMSCLINTHYPDHANRIADKVVLIHKKEKKAFFGSTEEMITIDNLKKIFDVDVCMKTFEEQGKILKTIIPFEK